MYRFFGHIKCWIQNFGKKEKQQKELLTNKQKLTDKQKRIAKQKLLLTQASWFSAHNTHTSLSPAAVAQITKKIYIHYTLPERMKQNDRVLLINITLHVAIFYAIIINVKTFLHRQYTRRVYIQYTQTEMPSDSRCHQSSVFC